MMAVGWLDGQTVMVMVVVVGNYFNNWRGERLVWNKKRQHHQQRGEKRVQISACTLFVFPKTSDTLERRDA